MTKKQLKKIIIQLVDLSFKDGKIIETQVAKSIKILKSLPRSQAIYALGEYLKSLKRKERQYTMIIVTSIPISLATIKKMRKIVEKKTKVTKVITQVNPEILGGFKLKIGDEVWDESILNKITQVKEAIGGRSN